jgi:D-alanyl-D-alanine carboxypeptidase (penicillin-binding protein 5/6)
MRCVNVIGNRPFGPEKARLTRSVAVLLTLLFTLYATSIDGAASPVPPVAEPAPRPPAEVAASAAFAVDLTTGVPLFALNADQPLPPASTMKIVTALVAYSILDLDARTVVEQGEVLDAEAFSVMGLLPGDDVSVRDLLTGLLVPSGGDAALVLARMGGRALDPDSDNPVGTFVEHMNAWALQHGLTASAFVNPTGDDAEGQHMSARDLVRAAALLLDTWLLARIVDTTETSVAVLGPNARELRLVNTNQLLSSPDVFGIKTGTDELAGQCLVGGFWRGDNRIVTVVLGSQDRYADTQALLDDVDARYRWLALGIGASSLGATDELAAMGLTFRVRRTVLMSQVQAGQVVWEFVEESPQGIGGRRGYVRFAIGEREFARLSVYSTTAPE